MYSRSGKEVARLRGHLHYSFPSAWHPDGITFSTGNQDKTCRIWDVRNHSKPITALKGNLGAIRSILYTSDGKFLAMAEPADFVHVFAVDSGYGRSRKLISWERYLACRPVLIQSCFLSVSGTELMSLIEVGAMQGILIPRRCVSCSPAQTQMYSCNVVPSIFLI